MSSNSKLLLRMDLLALINAPLPLGIPTNTTFPSMGRLAHFAICHRNTRMVFEEFLNYPLQMPRILIWPCTTSTMQPPWRLQPSRISIYSGTVAETMNL
ncbi:hypothetical protein DXG01_006551, partial [Tephrocybe rancida]